MRGEGYCEQEYERAVSTLDAVEAVLLQIDVDCMARGLPKTSPERERVHKGLVLIDAWRGHRQ